ncbi:MAG TPA: SdrD B-like domain-containing protein [Tepidisphaeraceae bacterium]|nr:SdrD B-like domain-containing protein [Tepidisphaeraceae bacterium]
MQIYINPATGKTTGGAGAPGADLVVNGTLQIKNPANPSDPTPYETYTGTLLTGTIVDNGYYFNNGSPSGSFDFTLSATGGTLVTGGQVTTPNTPDIHFFTGGQLVGMTAFSPFKVNSTTLTAPTSFGTGFTYNFPKVNIAPILPPDVTVSKVADAPVVNAGDTAGFTVTVSNIGQERATGISFSDPLPGGAGNDTNWQLASQTTPGAFSISGVPGSQFLDYTPTAVDGYGPYLESAASDSVHITSLTTPADAPPSASFTGALPNTAAVSAANEPPALQNQTASATVTVLAPDLDVLKTADQTPIHVGDSAGFTVKLFNEGAGLANNITLNDPLPGGDINWSIASGDTADFQITGAAGSQILSLAPGLTSLPAGQTLSVDIKGTTQLSDAGSLVNTATVNAGNETPPEQNDHSTATIIVLANPTIATTPGPGASVVVGSGSPLTDSATLTGGSSPTGTITFNLYAPTDTGYASPVYTDVVPVTAGTVTYSTGAGTITGSNLPTVAGNYQWIANYSGDANNTPASGKGGDEPDQVTQAQPIIVTTPSATNITLDATGAPVLTDTAVLSLGDNPTGTVTFTLSNGSNVLQTDTESVSAGSSTSKPYTLPMSGAVIGTYQWNATYNGDSNNNPVSENGNALEQTAVNPALPAIATKATEVGGNVVGVSTLTDAATLSGGYNPQGSITFVLTPPTGPAITEASVPVNGNNTYYAPTPVLATQVGTYTWKATYNTADGNNISPISDTGANELLTTTKAGPSIATTPGTSVVVGSGNPLTDQATLSAGYNPTGSITFNLYAPTDTGYASPVYTDVVPVTAGTVTYSTGAGTITGSNLPTVAGNYQWIASYSGDANNTPASGKGGDEPDQVTQAQPAIVTTPSATNITLDATGAPVLTDTAMLSLGDNPTGTVTFTLSNGSNVLQTDTESVSAGSSTSKPYTLPMSGAVTGTYQWNATYNGDSNNSTVSENGNALEQTAVNPAVPAIATQATEVGGSVVGVSTLTDAATLSGGYNPQGSITFVLTPPTGSPITEGPFAVNGNNTYYAPSVLATQVGTYKWKATYTGDGNNIGPISDNGDKESLTTVAASPTLKTTASDPAGSVVGIAIPQDSAVLSGGYNVASGTVAPTIVFTLTAPNGSVADTQTVNVTGDGTYSTSNTNVATQVGTYTWTAVYGGNALNSVAHDQGGACEQVIVTAPILGTISGIKYQDMTGNGFSSDDKPEAGVTIDLFADTNKDGKFDTGDVLVAKAVTGADGTYSFTNLSPGLYFLQEEVPSGWVQTAAPANPAVQVTGGNTYSGYNFDDYQEECNLANYSCIYYVIDGTRTVSSLAGNVQPGDEVTAYFTAAAHVTDQLSLVSYIAPDSTFNANDANQQVIFDQKTLSISTGNSPQTYSLGPVQIPNCDYQFDFVCGPAINLFGPAGGNGFYHQQNRIFASANGGSQVCSTQGSTISGIVFCDANTDKTLDAPDQVLAGATLTLTGTLAGGQAITPLTTISGSNGSYSFENLLPGTYTVTVTTPASGHMAEPGAPTSFTFTLPYNKDALGYINPMGNAADVNFAEISVGNIQGFCWDDVNNDGKVDWNEAGICGVTVNLSGTDYMGNKVSISCHTDDCGEYIFGNLMPGTYSITECQPAGFNEGTNGCGSINGATCGSLSGSDTICNIKLSGCGDNAINCDFGDKCTTTEKAGTTATIGFWHNSNGQALLKSLNGGSNATNLGNWLATSFPNMYGGFAGKTNSQIASFFITNDFNVTGVKLNAQVLSAAFACYVTNSGLAGGSVAASYGFTVNTNGTGYDLINVGSNGAAFGVANNTTISILQALNATDADAKNGALYATSEQVLGQTFSSMTLQTMANNVYSAVNQNGDI